MKLALPASGDLVYKGFRARAPEKDSRGNGLPGGKDTHR